MSEDEAAAPVEPVDVVVAAVLAVPGVAALSAGPAGSAATLLPGRRIDGIALRPTGTQVHVAVQYGVDVRKTARAVHEAVTALGPLAPQPVDVRVEDVIAS
ncbi:MAG: hypothetical protein PGN11_09795 [Quadrisphaera sp.]